MTSERKRELMRRLDEERGLEVIPESDEVPRHIAPAYRQREYVHWQSWGRRPKKKIDLIGFTV